jgi:transposase
MPEYPQLRRLFVGMDVHKDNHAAVAVNCFGTTLLEQEIGNEVKDFEFLLARVQTLARENQLVPLFGLENTAGSGDFLARFLFSRGMEVKTINPVLVKREGEYETHPEKSDLTDALGVAKVLIQRIDSVPEYSVTETTEIAKDIHALVKDRETIVLEQTRLKNQLHELLHHAYGSQYKTVFRDLFSKKALCFWQEFPSAHMVKRTHQRIVKPDWIVNADTAALPTVSATGTNQIKRKAGRLLAIRDELREIEKELIDLVANTGQQLHTLPGCGPILSATVLSEVKDIGRFKTPSELAKYAGLAPRKLESGKQKRHVKSRSGNRRLNRAVYQIALTQISNQGIEKAKAYFQKKVSEGKSKKHALTCLKRQIIDIIWSMLKEKRSYYP